MSLEARIQRIARGEVERALAGTELEEVKESEGGLAEQVRDLHEHLHRALTQVGKLAERVEALEKAAVQQPKTAVVGTAAEPQSVRAATPRRKRSSA